MSLFIKQTNTLQIILATNGNDSYAIFLYADGLIQWTTGDASGGSGGFGGTPAQAGFNAGDGINYATVPGSRTSQIVNISMTSNVGVPGMWTFKITKDIISANTTGMHMFMSYQSKSLVN